MSTLEFHKEFVFRCPAFSFSERIETIDKLKLLAKGDNFQTALYLASPVLYKELKKWLKGDILNEKEVKKLIFSIHKYLSRIHSRCTPYGLFASCSTGYWGQKDEILIDATLKRHTRLDMDLLCALSHHLSTLQSIRPYLKYYPNNSLYFFGPYLRYVQYNLKGNKRIHNIKSVDRSTYLDNILHISRNGVHLSNLLEILMNDDISKDDAENFVKEILESQILVSELEPTITGDEFLYRILDVLNKVNKRSPSSEIKRILEILNKVERTMALNDHKKEADVEIYYLVISILNELNFPLEEKVSFQVDSYRVPLKASLSQEVKQNLLGALEFLYKLADSTPNSNLERFRVDYSEQYQDKEIPLLTVLDSEAGIGYPTKDRVGINTFIDDLPIVGRSNGKQLTWNWKEVFLLNKIFDANKNNEYHVSFSDAEISKMPLEEGAMPITMPAKFRIVNPTTGKIQVFYFGGSSSANLLGRFAHGDMNIHRIVTDIANYEQEVTQDAIIAEIVHLPESRLGNVLSRPALRAYEIPYLGKSTLPDENQIPLSDLYVSVKNNKVVLRSFRLNKEVLPRLSTAHNFSYNTLPVYRFLCDLQFQNTSKFSLMFSWGILSENFKFLPRAEYKGIVVFPATWRLAPEDFNLLTKNLSSQYFMRHLKSWREKWKMPRYIALKDGDNELFIDLESELSIKTFLDAIRNRPSIELIEYIFDPDNALVRDVHGKPYNHEIFGIIFNNAYKDKSKNKNFESQISGKDSHFASGNRSFIIGSEWLYYKIYSGVSTIDRLLSLTIKPLIEDLSNHKLIEKWFFIRYADPETHIRLRLFTNDISKIADIIKMVYYYLNPLYQQGIIQKIANDTYVREIERYGNNSMNISEDYFTLDSITALNLLEFSERNNNEEIKWQYIVCSIDELLGCFNYTILEKLQFTEKSKNSLISEHGGRKELKIKLDEKFRKVRQDLEISLNNKFENNVVLQPVASLLRFKKAQSLIISKRLLYMKENNQLNQQLNDLLSSYIHLSINRIFKAKGRTYDMVIFAILHKYYKSLIARTSKCEKKIAEF